MEGYALPGLAWLIIFPIAVIGCPLATVGSGILITGLDAARVGGYGGGGGTLPLVTSTGWYPTAQGAAKVGGFACGAGDGEAADPDKLAGIYLQFVECATIESAGNNWQQRMHLMGRLEQRAVCVGSADCSI